MAVRIRTHQIDADCSQGSRRNQSLVRYKSREAGKLSWSSGMISDLISQRYTEKFELKIMAKVVSSG